MTSFTEYFSASYLQTILWGYTLNTLIFFCTNEIQILIIIIIPQLLIVQYKLKPTVKGGGGWLTWFDQCLLHYCEQQDTPLFTL